MPRPTFDEIRAAQVELIGPPRPPKMQPRSVPDFTETEAQALRDYLDALRNSSNSATNRDRHRDPRDP